MKQVVIAVLAFALLGFAFYSGKWYTKQQYTEKHRSEVVLENIEKVWKLSTVEANLSEIYKFQDYYYYDFSPLRKSALIRVNARVQAGFDFDSIGIQISEENRLIRFSQIPEPEILSIDHDLEYYDITEGTFNSFTTEELNALQSRAKDSIRTAAVTMNILNEAQSSKSEIKKLIALAVSGMGWEVIFDEDVSRVDMLD